jgi:hypothetical protein
MWKRGALSRRNLWANSGPSSALTERRYSSTIRQGWNKGDRTRGESVGQARVIRCQRYDASELTIQRFNPSTLQRGEAVGVGLSSAGLGETAGDGVAEAAASLLLASSISFFSST